MKHFRKCEINEKCTIVCINDYNRNKVVPMEEVEEEEKEALQGRLRNLSFQLRNSLENKWYVQPLYILYLLSEFAYMSICHVIDCAFYRHTHPHTHTILV